MRCPGQLGGIARYPGHIIIQEDVPAPAEDANVDKGRNSSGSSDKEGGDESIAGNNSATGEAAADFFDPRDISLTNEEKLLMQRISEEVSAEFFNAICSEDDMENEHQIGHFHRNSRKLVNLTGQYVRWR